MPQPQSPATGNIIATELARASRRPIAEMILCTLFSPAHELFHDTVRRFVAREIEPCYYEWEQQRAVPREVWRKAGAAGLLLCEVSTDYGGQGGGFLHATIVMEALVRVGANDVFFGLHSDIVAPYVAKYARENFRREWLPCMADVDAISAIAMTEPSACSDLKAIRTSAKRRGDHYVINGQKTFISNGQFADLVLVACKTDSQARRPRHSPDCGQKRSPGLSAWSPAKQTRPVLARHIGTVF